MRDQPQYRRYHAQPERRSGVARAIVVLLSLGALFGVAAAIFLIVKGARDQGPKPALDAFLRDWSKGDDGAAARRTDDPSAAGAALTANRKGLDGATLHASAINVKDAGDSGRARVSMNWTVPGIGDFAYETRVELHKSGGDWKVLWSPKVVHPLLDTATRLGTVRESGKRGAILDRNGKRLVGATPVVRVGAVAGKVKDPHATATGLARVLNVDAAPLERQIKGGGKQQFVEAVQLRESDYARVKGDLKGVPDVATFGGEAQLAPTRTFGRAVLGTVAPVTAEQLEKNPKLAASDQIGQWGLEAAFERRLAGAPERRVVIREDGDPIRRLLRRPGKPGRSLTTTLDRDVQSAAEQALGSMKGKAALIAVQPSSGDILAVANRPGDSSFDRALSGRYPPGSTFKVVSTAALLRSGLSVGETVACPKTKTVDGRAFKNFEGGAAGAVPFARDFQQSCNTAFVSLYKRVKAKSLSRTARDYGLGRRLRFGLSAAPASVPSPGGNTARAAAMIGQDKIVASPLAMAGVAAAVADGQWRSPRIVDSDPSKSGPPLPLGEVATLRTLMRSVVTGGTGTALAAVPGSPAGKTGTAEFGRGDPLPTHAWFIAFRGDVAVAVLVEKGASGGRVAAPIAARFLSAVPG